jgi:hypothetical protein
MDKVEVYLTVPEIEVWKDPNKELVGLSHQYPLPVR